MPLSEDKLRVWQVSGHELRIEFDRAFLEALRASAQSQFTGISSSLSARRGIILGIRKGATVLPESTTLVGSTLEPSLQAVSQASAAPVEGVAFGKCIVGWYSLRIARDISLSKDDLEYLDRPGADLREIALIVRPTSDQGIRFGVFFREKNGVIRGSSSYLELLVTAPPRPAGHASLLIQTTLAAPRENIRTDQTAQWKLLRHPSLREKTQIEIKQQQHASLSQVSTKSTKPPFGPLTLACVFVTLLHVLALLETPARTRVSTSCVPAMYCRCQSVDRTY